MLKDIKNKPVFSIIIITRNRKDELLKAIESCYSKVSLPCELIIVDNGSNDGTIELIESLNIPVYFQLRLIKAEHNLGVSGGRNAGVEMSSGEFLFFLDDDAYFEKDSECLDEIYYYMKENSEVGIVAVNIFDLRNNVYQNTTNFDPLHATITECYRYTGAAHAIRRESITWGQLYPDHLLYGSEETFAAIRVHANKQKVFFYPGVKVIHFPSKNTRMSNQEMAENILINLFVIKLLLLPKCFYPISWLLYLCRVFRQKKFDIREISRCDRLSIQRYRENFDARKSIGIQATVDIAKKYGIKFII